jgi:hypothetical protein
MNAEQLAGFNVSTFQRSPVPSFPLSQTFRLAKGESPSSTHSLQNCKLKSANSVLRDSEEVFFN